MSISDVTPAPSSGATATVSKEITGPPTTTPREENKDRALFAGEDIFLGNPFHHEVLTKQALNQSGFSLEAADDASWHADYIDSYLYNPEWWFNPLKRGGLDRFKAVLSIKPDLEKLHFDDLGTSKQVVSMWKRYMGGSLAGLYWAAEIYEKVRSEDLDREDLDPDPIAAAHNIIGVTMHSIQDFYSHSNWIDEIDRRGMSFLDSCEAEDLVLYTGWFADPNSSPKPHG